MEEIAMPNWSKSFETYVQLSEKQRLGIGLKSHEILIKEMDNLVEEESLRPTLYMMVLAPFASLEEELSRTEFKFIKEVTRYTDSYEKYIELVKKGQNEKIARFFEAYFKKVGGEVFTAYLSLALAILTIKGEVKEEDQKLIEKIYG